MGVTFDDIQTVERGKFTDEELYHNSPYYGRLMSPPTEKSCMYIPETVPMSKSSEPGYITLKMENSPYLGRIMPLPLPINAKETREMVLTYYRDKYETKPAQQEEPRLFSDYADYDAFYEDTENLTLEDMIKFEQTYGFVDDSDDF
jgi:hypothetical protein